MIGLATLAATLASPLIDNNLLADPKTDTPIQKVVIIKPFEAPLRRRSDRRMNRTKAPTDMSDVVHIERLNQTQQIIAAQEAALRRLIDDSTAPKTNALKPKKLKNKKLPKSLQTGRWKKVDTKEYFPYTTYYAHFPINGKFLNNTAKAYPYPYSSLTKVEGDSSV